jgi:hypothetical protein
MSFTDFKEVNVSNPGTSTKYGSDDLQEIMKILNGKVVASRQVRILNPFQFVDHVEIKAPAVLPTYPTLATVRHIVVDPADNHLKIQKTGGTMIDIDSLLANTWNASASETLTNKTISVDLNPVNHSTTNAAGELLINNGTRFARRAKGAALQILRVNAGATDLEYVDPSGITGGGEVNTVSNVGTAGVGVFKQKTGVNFELKKIKAASANISVTDNVGANQVDLDVNLAGITLGSLAGAVSLSTQVTSTLGVANGGTGAVSLTGLLKGAGTGPLTGIANGTTGQLLTMVGGVPAWQTPAASASGNAFFPDVTKWGGFWGGAAQGSGLFSGATINGVSITGDQTSSTDNFTTFITDNSDASVAGFVTANTVTRRSYAPVLNFRFKHGDTSNGRLWMGFNSDQVMQLNAGGDSPLDGISGLLFGYSDSHSTYQITYNGGAGSATFISLGTAKNTSVHDLQLEFDNTTNKVKVTFDGAVTTPGSSANTPATTTPLFVHFNTEAIGSNSIPLSLNYSKLVATE